MDKTESNDLLLSRPNGAFLLRFSDGTVGGITIAWVADNPEKPGMLQVLSFCLYSLNYWMLKFQPAINL